MRRHLLALAVPLALSGACGKKTTPTPAPVADAAEPTPPPAPGDTQAAPAPTPDTQAAPAPDAQAAPAEPDAQVAPAEADAQAAADAGAADPDGGAVAEADKALLERGAFIANVSGCALCHTAFGPNGPDLAKMWAGGLEIPEEVGTWRSPNITQDKKTGIGGWTDAEILAAVREGKRPDGSRLYPIMPWPFYHAMSDADGQALVAYLRTVAPIENAVAGNTDLKMPKMELPPPAGKAPEDTPLARGAYYASLMHCAACHTPMTEKGPDMSRAFAGGMKWELPMFGDGTLYASNITPHETGIGAWSDEELTRAIRELKKKDGSPIFGPMAMYQPAWSQLSDDTVKDLIAYLRSLPPIDNAVPKSTFVPKGPPPAPAPAPNP